MKPQAHEQRMGLAALVASLALAVLAFWSASPIWPCVDDPLTRWVALTSSSLGEVWGRAELTAHLPTFPVLVRLGHALGGDAGAWTLNVWLPAFGCVAAQVLGVHRFTGRPDASFVTGALSALLLPLMLEGACLRPYAWIGFLLSTSVMAVLELARRPGTSAILVLCVCATLAAHMSPLVAPVGAVLLGFANVATLRRRTRGLLLAACALQLALGYPVVAKVHRLAVDLPYHAWTEGAPQPWLWIYVIGALGVAATTLGRAHSSASHVPQPVKLLAALALVNPLALLAFQVATGEALFAPRYHVPEGLLSFTLVGLGVARLPARRVATAVGCCVVVGAAATSQLALRRLEPVLRPFAPRADLLRCVALQSGPEDVLVVTSAYAEAAFSRYYASELARSYLLADASQLPELSGRVLVPAPAGTAAPPPEWLPAVRELVPDRSLLWFVPRESWRSLWDPLEGGKQSAALELLVASGFEEVVLPARSCASDRAVVLRKHEPGSALALRGGGSP